MCSDIRTSQSVLFLGDYCTETIAAEDNFSYDRPTSFTCESLKARCHQMHAANLNSESLMHLSVELLVCNFLQIICCVRWKMERLHL